VKLGPPTGVVAADVADVADVLPVVHGGPEPQVAAVEVVADAVTGLSPLLLLAPATGTANYHSAR